jgi:hypothetical protein
MTRKTRIRLATGMLSTLGLACLLTLVAWAADLPFSGKWKGEMKTTPPAATPPASGTSGASKSGTTTASTTGEPSAPSTAGAGRTSGGFGGGRPGGGGFGGGGFGGGSGGPQKVTLNLKQSKDNKLSGNITVGEQTPEDVKEGRIVGTTISFKAGRPPQPIYEFYGELKDGELVLTRNAPGGRGGPQQIVLTRK